LKQAKKSYGQHFLVQETTASRIASFVDHLDSNSNLLEIGPGQGMLTKYLYKKFENFVAIEADKDMVTHLLNNYPLKPEALVQLDFLKLDLSKIFNGDQFSVIGNFPYNISSQIVFKIIESVHIVPEMVGMFQKEVAERIISSEGSKVYGVISVLTQFYYDGEMLLKLGPGAFSPPPKVNSAVIRLTRKKSFPDCNHRLFRTIVKQSFLQRRKMLRNSVKSLVINQELLINEVFNKRPEQLSLQEFVDLTNLIENNNKQYKNELGN
jgi:16S rRNA (adenine1518-N6/adenine1519-N6)-dimethyltransferase